jgi:hypothetical protein
MNTEEENKKQYKPYVIANPIYDTVFKKLMENERIAKFFISTILEEQVISLEICPQEFTYKKIKNKPNDVGYSIFRIDFMATILTKKGKQRKILIEVQKSWDESDIMRFRNYLGEQYQRKEKINGKYVVLPITTIYILGFNLKEIESACIRVKRKYEDMLKKKRIKEKSAFIEKLTHDSYVIQTGKITDERCSTKLEKLLSVFEQNHFIKENSEIEKCYPHQQDDEDIQFITSILYEMVADPREREEIEKEAEAMRIIDDLFGKKNREQKEELEKTKEELKKKDKALAKRDKDFEELKNQLNEKDKVVAELQKQMKEKDKAFAEMQKLMEEILRNQKG